MVQTNLSDHKGILYRLGPPLIITGKISEPMTVLALFTHLTQGW
jgi:hypothetical protein